jgi:hypothetical protein
MVSLDEFLPYVVPDCPGISDAGAMEAIISAAIEFCEKSLVLQADHDAISVKTGVVDYDLAPPTDHLICKVLKVWFRHYLLPPNAPDDVDYATVYNDFLSTSGGTPRVYFQKDARTLSVWPIPQADEASVITLRVALKPKRGATSVSDVLYEDWADVIAAGAKSTLQMTPGKPYGNPIAAQYNRNVFTAGVNRAMTRANKGNTRANLSVRMRRI